MAITDHVEGIVHEETQVHEDTAGTSSGEPSVADERSSSSPGSQARQDADVPEDADAIDLTAAELYEIAEPGRVDFGGGELEPADLEPHERVWRDEDDDYQWWHLEAGQYLLEFNETVAVSAADRLVLQPRDAILERGASHPTLHVEEIERIPLAVGGAGLRIKENARVSTLLEP